MRLDPIVAELRAERRRRGLSQTQVGTLIGRRSYQTVWQWESGTNDPGLSSVREWAAALGFDLALVPASEGQATAEPVPSSPDGGDPA